MGSFSKLPTDSIVWEPTPPFASQYACKFNAVSSKPSKFKNAFFNPFLNLLPNLGGNILVPLFSWALLIGIYVLNSEVIPINPLNSTDGQYTDNARVMLSTLGMYFGLSFIITALLFKQGCAKLTDLATSYRNAGYTLLRNPQLGDY